MIKINLTGSRLAGGNPIDQEKNDFYETHQVQLLIY